AQARCGCLGKRWAEGTGQGECETDDEPEGQERFGAERDDVEQPIAQIGKRAGGECDELHLCGPVYDAAGSAEDIVVEGDQKPEEGQQPRQAEVQCRLQEEVVGVYFGTDEIAGVEVGLDDG